MTIPYFRKKILAWYKKNKRAMPWRRTSDPYKILVSEVMLQQTQVARVIPKYKEFLQAFPTLAVLAQASDEKLLRVWQGLGYWRRALFLKETARRITQEYKGKFPRDIETLETLPGIGPYTACALVCFAFGSPEAFLDTNIRRVYLSFFFPSSDSRPRDEPRPVGAAGQDPSTRFARSGQAPKKISDAEILAIAQKAVWKKNPREWHYALFDYGATVLKDKAINRRSMHYHRQSSFEGSFRSFRTKTVRFLLAHPQSKVIHKTVEKFLAEELTKNPPRGDKVQISHSPEAIIGSLIKDNLIKKSRSHYFL